MREAAEFFKLFEQVAEFWDCPLAVENPIPHKYAVELIGRKYDQLIQPYHFGHLESKAICLWLRKLPKLIHTNDVKQEMLALPKRMTHKVHYASSTLKDREEVRSEFFTGIAKAFAQQWAATHHNTR
jgi:hypothetical protein